MISRPFLSLHLGVGSEKGIEETPPVIDSNCQRVLSFPAVTGSKFVTPQRFPEVSNEIETNLSLSAPMTWDSPVRAFMVTNP